MRWKGLFIINSNGCERISAIWHIHTYYLDKAIEFYKIWKYEQAIDAQFKCIKQNLIELKYPSSKLERCNTVRDTSLEGCRLTREQVSSATPVQNRAIDLSTLWCCWRHWCRTKSEACKKRHPTSSKTWCILHVTNNRVQKNKCLSTTAASSYPFCVKRLLRDFLHLWPYQFPMPVFFHACTSEFEDEHLSRVWCTCTSQRQDLAIGFPSREGAKVAVWDSNSLET